MKDNPDKNINGETAQMIANYFGVVVDEEECIKINAAVKQFNSRGFGRILTNIWLSLIPVRSWRIRFCWWSMLPAGSKFHDARTGETAAVVCKEPATPAHGKKKGV